MGPLSPPCSCRLLGACGSPCWTALFYPCLQGGGCVIVVFILFGRLNLLYLLCLLLGRRERRVRAYEVEAVGTHVPRQQPQSRHMDLLLALPEDPSSLLLSWSPWVGCLQREAFKGSKCRGQSKVAVEENPEFMSTPRHTQSTPTCRAIPLEVELRSEQTILCLYSNNRGAT